MTLALLRDVTTPIPIVNDLPGPPFLTPSEHSRETQITLLFSDVVGSTQLMEELGDWSAHHIIQRHHRIVRRELALHGGEEVELRGDGFYLAFKCPLSALRCAVAIQRGLALDGLEHPEHPIRVRMGLHSGPALRDANTYFGKTVVQSVRIADHARAGEILVSQRFRELVEGLAGLDFGRDRSLVLKGFRGYHRVSSVRWDAPPRINGFPAQPTRGRAKHVAISLRNLLGRVGLVRASSGRSAAEGGA